MSLHCFSMFCIRHGLSTTYAPGFPKFITGFEVRILQSTIPSFNLIVVKKSCTQPSDLAVCQAAL